MKIVTNYWRKPIPTNAFDWQATTDAKLRREEARKQLAREGMSFQKAKAGRKSIGDAGAFEAGQRAGNGASFGRPVNGGAGPRLIGAT